MNLFFYRVSDGPSRSTWVSHPYSPGPIMPHGLIAQLAMLRGVGDDCDSV